MITNVLRFKLKYIIILHLDTYKDAREQLPVAEKSSDLSSNEKTRKRKRDNDEDTESLLTTLDFSKINVPSSAKPLSFSHVSQNAEPKRSRNQKGVKYT